MTSNGRSKLQRILSIFLAFLFLFGSITALFSCKDGNTTTGGSETTDPEDTTASPPTFTDPEDFEDIPVQGIYTEYYNGRGLNTFVNGGVLDTVGGVFSSGSAPIAGLDSTNYSILWSGRIKAPYSGTVTFTTAADDGVILTVGGKMLVSDGGPHYTERHSGTMEMVKDTLYEITVEYYNGDLGGDLMLEWSYDGISEEVPAEALYLPKYPVRLAFSYTDTTETVRAYLQTDSDTAYTLILKGIGANGEALDTVTVTNDKKEGFWEATMTANDAIKSYTAYVTDETGKIVSPVGSKAHKEDIHITVDPTTTLGSVSDLLYGACMEDVNHELYGGIWSQMIFGEHFEEPATASGEEFTVAGGDWKLKDEGGERILAIANTPNGPKLVANKTVSTSGSISADIYVDGEGAGFIVKTSNATAGADSFDGYEVSLFNNMVRVAKHEHNYANIKDTSVSAPLRTWVNLKVETTQNTITVYVNGTNVFTYTDPTPLTSGAFGFRAWNASAKYKNVKVKVGNGNEETLSFAALGTAQSASGMWQATVKGNVGTASIITQGVYSGKQSQRLTFIGGEGSVSVNNMGLNRMGMNLTGGKDYQGYIIAKSLAPLTVYLAFENKDGSVRYAETQVTVSGDYQKYAFSLTPNASDDTGRFVIELRSQGTLDLGYVFLEPGEWGLYKGLHVRRDVGELYEKQGISVLRFGGCMANAADWKWKNMTGAPETRKIYKGWWYEYSSYGFGIIEFLDLCEALGVVAIPDFSSYETAADMTDFVEFALGTDPDNEWVKLRKTMGREEPYNLKYIQIGNEDKVDAAFAIRFNRIANAIWAIDSSLTLVVGDFEYKDLITDPNNITGATSGITSLAGQQKILENALEKGGKVLFDIHFWSESGTDPMRFFPAAISFYEGLKTLVPKADFALCVLELNANNHDLERALCNAMAISNAERISDIIRIMCSANALQVDKQNDNGWNQGLIFMDNTGAWYQPPAYVDRLFYDCHLDTLASFSADETVNTNIFDVTVLTSEDGKTVSVKIVNRTGQAKGIGITILGFENATLRLVTMEGGLKMKNTTENKEAIKPKAPLTVENALELGSELIQVAPYSVTTVVFSAQ